MKLWKRFLTCLLALSLAIALVVACAAEEEGSGNTDGTVNNIGGETDPVHEGDHLWTDWYVTASRKNGAVEAQARYCCYTDCAAAQYRSFPNEDETFDCGSHRWSSEWTNAGDKEHPCRKYHTCDNGRCSVFFIGGAEGDPNNASNYKEVHVGEAVDLGWVLCGVKSCTGRSEEEDVHKWGDWYTETTPNEMDTACNGFQSRSCTVEGCNEYDYRTITWYGTVHNCVTAGLSSEHPWESTWYSQSANPTAWTEMIVNLKLSKCLDSWRWCSYKAANNQNIYFDVVDEFYYVSAEKKSDGDFLCGTMECYSGDLVYHHSYGDWTVTTKPNADGSGCNGVMERTCNELGCGYTDKKEIKWYGTVNDCADIEFGGHLWSDQWRNDSDEIQSMIEKEGYPKCLAAYRGCTVNGYAIVFDSNDLTYKAISSADYEGNADSYIYCGKVECDAKDLKYDHVCDNWQITTMPNADDEGCNGAMEGACKYCNKAATYEITWFDIIKDCTDARLGFYSEHSWGEWADDEKIQDMIKYDDYPACMTAYRECVDNNCVIVFNPNTLKYEGISAEDYNNNQDSYILCGMVICYEEDLKCDHNWSDWEVMQQPNWDEKGCNGEMERICQSKNCYKVDTYEITWYGYLEDCTEHGFFSEHNWGEWIDNPEYIQYLIETEGYHKCTTAIRGCSNNTSDAGKIYFSVKDMDYLLIDSEEELDEKSFVYCGEADCEAVDLKLDHAWGNWKVTKTATTSQTGSRERVCKVCGEKETRKIAKLTETAKDHLEALIAKNADASLWLTVTAGANLDFAIMQRDNAFYFDHNVYGEADAQGAAFIDENNKLADQHLLISASEKTVFGDLIDFRTEEALAEYAEMVIDTLDTERTYKLYAAFDMSIDPNDSLYFDLQRFSFDTDAAFTEFVNAAIERSLYTFDAEAQPGDQLLTLSVWNSKDANERFVLMLVSSDN